MTKSDLYKDILQKLANYLRDKNLITADEHSEVQEEIDMLSYHTAADKLAGIASVSDFKKVLDYLKSGLSDMDDLSTSLTLRKVTISENNKKRIADFAWLSSNLNVVTAKAIRNLMTLQHPDAAYEGVRFKVLELIWLLSKDQDSDFAYLWEICRGQHAKDYYIFSDEPDTLKSNWRLYAYSYFCFVNESGFKYPDKLSFNPSKKFVSSIPYNSGKRYEQYFDAFDVMSESKFSYDVLQRYLRMYQILEYFGYRRTLAEMTKGNIRENGFVRNVIAKTNAHGSKESEEIKKGIRSFIPDLTTIIVPTDVTSNMQDFIKHRLLISYVHDHGHLWETIYKLRCCIVHNKESELHFTYSNTDEYEHGISLMKMLIDKLEPVIANAINDPLKTEMEFENPIVQLY